MLTLSTTKMKINLPIRTESEANKCEHWHKRYKRSQKQKDTIRLLLIPEIKDLINTVSKMRVMDVPITLQITLTRVAPRKLDGDNLQISFKSIRDFLSDIFIPGLAPGRADDDEMFDWKYSQRKGVPKEYSVDVEFLLVRKTNDLTFLS